jgi:hypothetical protein
MKLHWEITSEDVEKIQTFIREMEDNSFVRRRKEQNLASNKPSIPIKQFWNQLIVCLLTTQQRSGPNHPVRKFLNTSPFPLSWEKCLEQSEPGNYSQKILSRAGIHRSNIISEEIVVNLQVLTPETWDEISQILNSLRNRHSREDEKHCAAVFQSLFKGIGPKQSRNLIQGLGLGMFEIPLDSRITRWLNTFGFPIKLTA